MIRKLGITLITLTVLWSGIALGALEALEEVAEVSTAGIRLPASAAGRVVHRQCNSCEATIWPVNAATTYHIGIRTAPVSLAELKRAVATRKYELIYVFYAPDSGIATRLVLSPSQGEEK